MKFCPNCETKLTVTMNKQSIAPALEYQCPKCGYTLSSSHLPQDHEVQNSNMRDEAIVIFDQVDQNLRTMPTSKTKCPKCTNDLAYVWQVQTRSGDEGPTQFFRCTACNHTWRLYT